MLKPKEPKYAVGDIVHFFDDPELGVVQTIHYDPRDEEHVYLVKFGGTVDNHWPGFVYPERYLQPELLPES